MSNFSFLKQSFSFLYTDAAEAEKHTLSAPKYAAILCRSTLEKAINWLFDNDPDLNRPYNENTLSILMHQTCFKNIVNRLMFREINNIRLTGNNAAHGKSVNQTESMVALKGLFRFLSFVARYYSEEYPEVPPFDEALIPDEKQKDKTLAELQKVVDELTLKAEKLQEERTRANELARENDLLSKQIQAQKETISARKEERKQLPEARKAIPQLIPEALTRKIFIDSLLKEAGWDNLHEGRELEYPVFGMPTSTNPTGTGYADYVLWGDNGLPLAVIEAKKTSVDAHTGQYQAELYANCLENMTGQRPVIFYTNGFETHIWDDTFYPPREVSGFYAKDELQLLIDRRKTRLNVNNYKVDTQIAGRPYQMEAIQRVAETLATQKTGKLAGKSRKALLVMATGSGKTRVSAAIVDMLTKCNWVKRVLFLADRNALVTQAKNAFTTYLPQLSSIDLTREKEDNGTRLVFSTYQTIMNKIDSLKNEESRFYSPGHFDLIIIDEAHRSVYQKYGAIFRYFDSLLIGLTATPKTDIDRNTYSLFDIDDNNPTFAYELNQAVTDGYLVPPKAIKVQLRFPREGIRYHELSDAEKEEYEKKFGDPTTGEADDTISNNALNSWLFNTNTVDRVLAFLMDNGIKTQGGDKLGKTIIFARNHKHALFIEERFNKMYPEYGGSMLRVIDNFEPKAQELLTNFCYTPSEDNPQIAVSVDMMDTGVDAPRAVNLVFFKPVKSATKYWQMIGRGTRLFPNLFGPGKDKKHFLIFDFCQNFEFFGENPEGIETSNQKSISQRIFEAKLDIALRLLSNNETTPEDLEVAKKYIDELHKLIATLDENRFEVRLEMRMVNEYCKRQRWENISRTDFNDICNQLSKLPVPATEDENAKRFDLMILNLQLYKILDDTKQNTIIIEVAGIGKRLLKKKNIPAVNAKIETINNVQNEEFWQKVTYKNIEQVRCDLRDLIKFLDKEQKYDVFTNFEDYLNLDMVEELDIIPSYTSMQSYRERVERYIKEHKDHLVIHKIRKNQQITPDELQQLENILFKSEIGTKEEYQKEYGDIPLVKFIRSIVGLDTEAVQQLFADFIQAGSLTANQITFINTIISYLTKNGTINKEILFEPPFDNIHDQGISGLFKDKKQLNKIFHIIDKINENATG